MGYFENMNLLLLTAGGTENALLEQISLYMTQLEEYDRTSANFVLTCIAFAGVIFGIIATLLNVLHKQQNDENSKAIKPRVIEKAIAILFLTLPSIMTLCLYVFSMQCRRVAFFRGYLKYLEEELSKRIEVPLLFNTKIVQKYFGECWTNRIGPVVMIVFILSIMAVGVGFSWHYAKAFEKPRKGRRGGTERPIIIYYGLFRGLPIICIIACAIFTLDLVTNDSVMESVYQYCVKLAGG